MSRSIALAVVALAGLAACTTPPPQASSQPTLVTNVIPYRAGTGVVQNVSPAPVSAAAGGTTLQRLEIRMSDGTIQYIDAPSGHFTKGMRVQLSEDKRISPV